MPRHPISRFVRIACTAAPILALALGLAAPTIAADFRTDASGAYATVNGARLFYWTEGHGEPLLVIEGGPGAAGYLV